jgi:hypothetical protein
MSLAHDEDAAGPDKAMHFTLTFSNLKSKDSTFIPGMLADCERATSKLALSS